MKQYKQYRLGGYNFVVAAPLAELLMLRLAWSLSGIFLPLTCCFGASRGKRSSKPRIYRSVWERLVQNLDKTVRALLHRVAWKRSSWGWCLRDFFDGKHWKYLPAHERTVGVFKILSRMCCAAQEHLFLPHEQFPTKLILLLEDTDLGDLFVKTWKTKKCTLDVFSAAYIAKYKVAGFDDPEAKIVLQQVAQSMRVDIADIQSRHASVRRMLKSVVQTHINKANMSAQVVGRSLAKRQQRAGGRGVVSVVATRQKRSEGSNIKKRRAVRSAWAFFIREQSAGKKADFWELRDKYRDILHEEYQRLQARGSLVAPARGEKRKHRAFVTPRLLARNGIMATLPSRAQPDQGVGQHVGHCKSRWRKDGVFAQRSQSRGPRQHGNGTGEGQGVLTDHCRRCSCINLAPLSLH